MLSIKKYSFLDRAWDEGSFILTNSVFFTHLWYETKWKSIREQNKTGPISSHLDRTNFVNNGQPFLAKPKREIGSGQDGAIVEYTTRNHCALPLFCSSIGEKEYSLCSSRYKKYCWWPSPHEAHFLSGWSLTQTGKCELCSWTEFLAHHSC